MPNKRVINLATKEDTISPLSVDEEIEAAAMAEADAANAPNRIRAEIAQMERDALMPRATREFMLAFMETNFTPQQLAGNPGYQKMKAFDNQIRALRETL